MKSLSDYQKKFLLDCFFYNEKYAGWQNIGLKLLETGQCIVAGKECIWHGGIGNFIETEKAENAVDCTLYKFDLNYFLTSAWYKEVRIGYKDTLLAKKKDIEQEYKNIKQEIKEVSNI